MIILGMDTSGREGSVALARGTETSFEVLGFMPLAGGAYSAQLIPSIAALLERAGLGKSALDLLAVASGPGSFTGLRVGLSTVKGLAEALHKPIVAVSVLEAVAVASRQTARVISALDAQRNEVYTGEYEIARSDAPSRLQIRTLSESLSSLAEFATWIGARIPVPVTYTPDPAVESAVRDAGSPVERITRPAADLIARIGFSQYLRGLTISPEALDANYIRRSDAEIVCAASLGARPR